MCFMRDNGRITCGRAGVNNIGQMDRIMRVIGQMTWLVDWGD